ncbi:MAG: hypothetical protein ACKV0T_06755 [Planctomycetales bacterium]
MSILADIYISGDDDAVKYDTAPDQFADSAHYKGVTPLELSMLWSILRGIEWDVALLDEFPSLLQDESRGRYIHRLPPALVSELATLAPDRMAAVTSAWAATEELSCSPDEIQPVVDDLMRLSRRSLETSQSVYVWNGV